MLTTQIETSSKINKDIRPLPPIAQSLFIAKITTKVANNYYKIAPHDDNGINLTARPAHSLLLQPQHNDLVLILKAHQQNYIIQILQTEDPSKNQITRQNLNLNIEQQLSIKAHSLRCHLHKLRSFIQHIINKSINYKRETQKLEQIETLHQQTNIRAVKYERAQTSISRHQTSTIHTNKFLVNS